jgi:hypothetical protein
MSKLKEHIKEKIKEIDIKEYTKIYLGEFIEALIAITVVKSVLNKKIRFNDIILSSVIVATVTFILENFSPDTKKSVKNGINMSIGSSLMNKFTK